MSSLGKVAAQKNHLPKLLVWQPLNYLPSSLPKLFKYVWSWSNRKVLEAHSQQLSLWAVRDQTFKKKKTAKNKGLSGLLKMLGPQQPKTSFIQWNRLEILNNRKLYSNTSKTRLVSVGKYSKEHVNQWNVQRYTIGATFFYFIFLL